MEQIKIKQENETLSPEDDSNTEEFDANTLLQIAREINSIANYTTQSNNKVLQQHENEEQSLSLNAEENVALFYGNAEQQPESSDASSTTVSCHRCHATVAKEEFQSHLIIHSTLHVNELHENPSRMTEFVLQCYLCKKDFITIFHVEKHLMIEHDFCRVCGVKVASQPPIKHVESHKQALQSTGIYQCSICYEEFPFYSFFKNHYIASHSKLICKMKTTDILSGRSFAVKMLSQPENGTNCPYCHYSTTSHAAIISHIYLHRPTKCCECNKLYLPSAWHIFNSCHNKCVACKPYTFFGETSKIDMNRIASVKLVKEGTSKLKNKLEELLGSKLTKTVSPSGLVSNKELTIANESREKIPIIAYVSNGKLTTAVHENSFVLNKQLTSVDITSNVLKNLEFPCLFCPLYFKEIIYLHNHILKIHSTCTLCAQSFATFAYCIIHTSIRHPEFICQICGSRFVSMLQYFKHYETLHQNDRKGLEPYVRVSCGANNYYKMNASTRLCVYCLKMVPFSQLARHLYTLHGVEVCKKCNNLKNYKYLCQKCDFNSIEFIDVTKRPGETSVDSKNDNTDPLSIVNDDASDKICENIFPIEKQLPIIIDDIPVSYTVVDIEKKVSSNVYGIRHTLQNEENVPSSKVTKTSQESITCQIGDKSQATKHPSERAQNLTEGVTESRNKGTFDNIETILVSETDSEVISEILNEHCCNEDKKQDSNARNEQDTSVHDEQDADEDDDQNPNEDDDMDTSPTYDSDSDSDYTPASSKTNRNEDADVGATTTRISLRALPKRKYAATNNFCTQPKKGKQSTTPSKISNQGILTPTKNTESITSLLASIKSTCKRIAIPSTNINAIPTLPPAIQIITKNKATSVVDADLTALVPESMKITCKTTTTPTSDINATPSLFSSVGITSKSTPTDNTENFPSVPPSIGITSKLKSTPISEVNATPPMPLSIKITPTRKSTNITEDIPSIPPSIRVTSKSSTISEIDTTPLVPASIKITPKRISTTTVITKNNPSIRITNKPKSTPVNEIDTSLVPTSIKIISKSKSTRMSIADNISRFFPSIRITAKPKSTPINEIVATLSVPASNKNILAKNIDIPIIPPSIRITSKPKHTPINETSATPTLPACIGNASKSTFTDNTKGSPSNRVISKTKSTPVGEKDATSLVPRSIKITPKIISSPTDITEDIPSIPATIKMASKIKSPVGIPSKPTSIPEDIPSIPATIKITSKIKSPVGIPSKPTSIPIRMERAISGTDVIPSIPKSIQISLKNTVTPVSHADAISNLPASITVTSNRKSATSNNTKDIPSVPASIRIISKSTSISRTDVIRPISTFIKTSHKRTSIPSSNASAIPSVTASTYLTTTPTDSIQVTSALPASTRTTSQRKTTLTTDTNISSRSKQQNRMSTSNNDSKKVEAKEMCPSQENNLVLEETAKDVTPLRRSQRVRRKRIFSDYEDEDEDEDPPQREIKRKKKVKLHNKVDDVSTVETNFVPMSNNEIPTSLNTTDESATLNDTSASTDFLFLEQLQQILQDGKSIEDSLIDYCCTDRKTTQFILREENPVFLNIPVQLEEYNCNRDMESSQRIDSIPCVYCSLKFTDLISHFKHNIREHFLCKICQKQHVDYKSLISHLKMHVSREVQVSVCKKCIDIYTCQEDWQNHVSQAHNDEVLDDTILINVSIKLGFQECPYCCLNFTRDIDLFLHIFHRHQIDTFCFKSAEKRVKKLSQECFVHEIGKKTVQQPSKYSKTLVNIPCKLCPFKSFSLQKHGDHLEQIHFLCKPCNILHSDLLSLKIHSLKHEMKNIVTYSCKECVALFYNLDDCKKHLNEHTIPFQSSDVLTNFMIINNTVCNNFGDMECPYCCLNFFLETSLIRHVAKKHNM